MVRDMGTTVWTRGQAGPAQTFDSVNPATSEVIATFPAMRESEVAAAVERAQFAASWWAGLDWKERRIRLLAWKSHITRYMGRLAELVHTETGKPLADAQLEIILAIVHIDWAAKNARKVLGARRVRSGLIAINQASTVGYQPLGVIGVIGPWNYPVRSKRHRLSGGEVRPRDGNCRPASRRASIRRYTAHHRRSCASRWRAEGNRSEERRVGKECR